MLLLLCTIVVRTAALAPSFDTFSAAATGSWTGTQYQWTADGATNGVPCTAVVDEVMRSCGGAVQGVRVGDGPLLNRQDDGFCFFDCGSWMQGPTKLTDGALNVDVGLMAQSGSRVRCTASTGCTPVHTPARALMSNRACGTARRGQLELRLHRSCTAAPAPHACAQALPATRRLTACDPWTEAAT